MQNRYKHSTTCDVHSVKVARGRRGWGRERERERERGKDSDQSKTKSRGRHFQTEM